MRKITALALSCLILFVFLDASNALAASKSKRAPAGSRSSAVLRRMLSAQSRFLMQRQAPGSPGATTGTVYNKLNILGNSGLILNYGSPLDDYIQYRNKYLKNPYADYSILGIMGYGGYSDFNPYSLTGSSAFSSQ